MIEPESNEKQTGNFNLKEQQQSLFTTLRHVLDVSGDKFDKEKALNGDRLKWGRLIVSAVEAYGKLLESIKLAEMEERIKLLEEHRIENHGEVNQEP